MNERIFGPYRVDVDGNHCTIRRVDCQPCEPSFYEMQHMKSMTFGGPATSIEVFPAASQLVDGQNHRHLWLVDSETVPNLKTGYLVKHETALITADTSS